MTAYIPSVVQVAPHEDYTVDVYFDDGKITRYDVSGHLDGEVFAPLRDKDFFLHRCTILNDSLAWDMGGDGDASACVDIDPITLYELPSINFELAKIESA